MKQFSILITAGGIGKRMGAEVPKQFLLIKGKPILMHTLERMYTSLPQAQLVLTLPGEWIDVWNELLSKHHFTIQHEIVEGGEERYDSIRNGLNFCTGEYIAIHDGVRPFVSLEVLSNIFHEVITKKAVIPVLPVKESLRKKQSGGTEAVDRNEYYIVQTPQCFTKEVLENAYSKEIPVNTTDDATLVEHYGTKIYTVAGNEENIKITSPVDLQLAEIILSGKIK